MNGTRGDDTVLPFQLDRSALRGRVARLDDTLAAILARRPYPAPVAALVAEAALLTALIGAAMKLRWKLSLQIRGDGPVRLIATDYFAPQEEGAPAQIRAWASYDEEDLTDAPGFEQLGQGVFGILIHQGDDMKPYQGITPLAGGSLAACAGTYFAQSEQIATRFALMSAEATQPGGDPAWRAGGVMLQQLPEAGMGVAPEAEADGDGLMTADAVAAMGSDEEGWNRANILLDTVDAHELIGPLVSPEALLVRLFHEERPRIFPVQRVEFGCTCSEDRVRNAMSIYSSRDIGHMTTDDGKVTADCQFCGAHYEFEPDELGFETADGRERAGDSAPPA